MALSSYTGANGVVWFWSGKEQRPDLNKDVPSASVTQYSINVETEVLDTTDLGCTDRINTDGLRQTVIEMSMIYNSTNASARMLNKIIRPRIPGARAGIANQQLFDESTSDIEEDQRRFNIIIGVKDILPLDGQGTNTWPGDGDVYTIEGRAFIRSASLQCQVGSVVTATFSLVLNGAVIARNFGPSSL